jgi:hypothetical protein
VRGNGVNVFAASYATMRRMTRPLLLAVLAAVLGLGCSPVTGEPRPCVATRDCLKGETCSTGTCAPAAARSCMADADCGAGGGCLDGVCAGGTACHTLADCAGGEACDPLSGVCLLATCDDRGGCPNGGACDFAKNRCARPRACQQDSQCGPPNALCDGGFCAPGCAKTGCAAGARCLANGRCGAGPGCTNDAMCAPPATVCRSGDCVSGCTSGSCAAGEKCDALTGRCNPIASGCAKDSDCAPPASICENGACVPGCGSAGCQPYEDCSAARGRCDVRSCGGPADCAPPAGTCDTGICVAGCGLKPCAGGTCVAASGLCDGGPAPLDARCTANLDCASRFCFTPGTTPPQPGVCATLCGTTADCAPGRRCTEHAQTPGIRACLSGAQLLQVVGAKRGGESCATADECQSGLALASPCRCVDVCTKDSDCAAGEHCRGNQLDGTGHYVQICRADRDFPGLSATYPSTCSASCASLFCDDLAQSCFSGCCRSTDCGAGGRCVTILPYFTGDPDHPSATALKGCVDVAAAGTAPVGASCRLDDGLNCRSNFCVGTRGDGAPVSPTDAGAGYCSDTCCTDRDCPSGYGCGAAFDDRSGYSFALCLRF